MSKLLMSRPADTWLEKFPLGNGVLGAMADGGVPTSRIDLNHEAGWSGWPGSEREHRSVDAAEARRVLAEARNHVAEGEPAEAAVALKALQSRYSQAFLPLGTLVLERNGTLDGYERQLDLATGVHSLRAGELSERMVASREYGVLAVSSTGRPQVAFESPLREISRRTSPSGVTILLRFPSDVPPHFEDAYPSASWSSVPGEAVEAAIAVRWEDSEDHRERFIVVAIETTAGELGTPLTGTAHDAADRAEERARRALAVSPDSLFASAATEHGLLFDRAHVEFAGEVEPPTDLELRRRMAFSDGRHPLCVDPGLAALMFDFGRYLAIASSYGGTVPPTLQGLWNGRMRPPWSSNFTLNINTQMNHWSTYSTNLAETGLPLWSFVEALSEKGRHTARQLYDSPGWVSHHNSDAWLFSSPVGDGHGDARWSHWPMAGPWLVRALWDTIEFGAGGRAAAERLWPIARGATEFILAWQHLSPSGDWVTSPATSPENVYLDHNGTSVAVDRTSAMDEQLIADLYETVTRLALMLGLDGDPVVEQARSRSKAMHAQPCLSAEGTIVEWAEEREEVDPQHRHMSSLYGLFPGPGLWSTQAKEAAAATLRRRGDVSTGWSLVWKIALWARLDDAEKVSDLLQLMFCEAESSDFGEQGGLYLNMFAAHPPFQIDANLGFPGALTECLIQSHDGITLLPAVPAQLASGSARGLVARPGVEVDLVWIDGALDTAVLRSSSTVRVRVRYLGRVIEVEVFGQLLLTTGSFCSATLQPFD